jgi:hypothetical protein
MVAKQRQNHHNGVEKGKLMTIYFVSRSNSVMSVTLSNSCKQNMYIYQWVSGKWQMIAMERG